MPLDTDTKPTPVGLSNKRSNAGGGKKTPYPKPPNVMELLANDPGGSAKEDLYRLCLLQDVEQCNWRMRRAMKGN